jgi:hypothetical protein
MSGPLVQAELAGGRGGPAAAGDADLADNAGHVHADGLHGDEQLSRDLAVAPADRDEPEHLELTGGEAPVLAVAGWPGSAILARRASWAICLASGRVQPLRHTLDVRVRRYRDPLDADQAEEIWNVLAQEYRQYPMGALPGPLYRQRDFVFLVLRLRCIR